MSKLTDWFKGGKSDDTQPRQSGSSYQGSPSRPALPEDSDQVFVGQTAQGSGRAAAKPHDVGAPAPSTKRLSLEKDIDERVSDQGTRERLKVSLRKSSLSLEKFDLIAHMAMVYLLVDFSSSMGRFYDNGSVQRLLEQCQVLGLNFDDNGALDTSLFSSSALYCGELSLDTLEGFVDGRSEGRGQYRYFRGESGESLQMGNTDYVSAFKQVLDLYKERLSDGPDNDGCDQSMPMFVIFVTDGAPNPGTERAILRVLENMSEYPIYVKGLCIENLEYRSDFRFLNEMAAKRRGLKVVNFSYDVVDFSRLDDSESLTDLLVGDYAKRFIPEAHDKGILLRG